MSALTRRNLLSASAVIVPLSLVACATTGGTSFDMAKLYANDVANAVAGAATAYLAGPPAPSEANAALVTQIVNDLQAAVTVLNSAPNPTDAKSTLLQIVAGVQELAPLVSPLLGPAAPYVPLAIAVIQAFIQSLPPPVNAPVTPPAALHRAAMHYKGRG